MLGRDRRLLVVRQEELVTVCGLAMLGMEFWLCVGLEWVRVGNGIGRGSWWYSSVAIFMQAE